MTQVFCSNEPCEAEAVAVYISERGTRCPLCHTCREAFEWGQASVGAEVVDIDQHTDEDEEGTSPNDEQEDNETEE